MKLTEQYINYVLENGEAPKSIYQFAKIAGIEEKVFYDEYSSFEALEKGILEDWLSQAITGVSETEIYAGYTSRERILAVFFGWIEQLKTHRSFVMYLSKKKAFKGHQKLSTFLVPLKATFVGSMKEILDLGISSKEIVERKYLSDKYVEGVWMNFMFITNFWVDDTSKDFEKTDEAIEKSVNLLFDLMGRSPLDSMLEFGKFLFQNKS